MNSEDAIVQAQVLSGYAYDKLRLNDEIKELKAVIAALILQSDDGYIRIAKRDIEACKGQWDVKLSNNERDHVVVVEAIAL